MIHSILTAAPANLLRCLALPTLLGFVILCAFLAEWLRARQGQKPHNAIDSSNYRAPAHTHLVDFERSTMRIQSDGSVIANCCMQGCECTVQIGKGVLDLSLESRALRRQAIMRAANN